jgi:hypothetical protein
VSGGSSFLVEDFINSITVQLDKVQDALRVKSVNRPLTYALRDFSLDLQVFVELDPQGNVRFRNSAPNETGASTVKLGFTTITKPMIDENTISLAVTRSPSLDQLGLKPEERRKLEQLGVHNAAQLQNLSANTGTNTVARLADLRIERLREALQEGKPRVNQVTPGLTPGPSPEPPLIQPGPLPVQPPIIRIAPGTPHLNLHGAGLIGMNGPATVRLNREPLSLAHADDERLIVNLPEAPRSGALEITLPDGDQLAYHLEIQSPTHDGSRVAVHGDRWEPTERRM